MKQLIKSNLSEKPNTSKQVTFSISQMRLEMIEIEGNRKKVKESERKRKVQRERSSLRILFEKL